MCPCNLGHVLSWPLSWTFFLKRRLNYSGRSDETPKNIGFESQQMGTINVSLCWKVVTSREKKYVKIMYKCKGQSFVQLYVLTQHSVFVIIEQVVINKAYKSVLWCWLTYMYTVHLLLTSVVYSAAQETFECVIF